MSMADAESWENAPSFSDLGRSIYVYLETTYHEIFVETRPPHKLDSWNVTIYDITYITMLTAVLSAVRLILTTRVFMPIAKYYDIPEASRKKVPESAWRFTYFLFVWCYEWYVVVLSGKYKFFHKPETMLHGWSLEALPPADIYFIYVLQTAFYVHFIYATLFLDTWRKDSVVMVLHHVYTLILIFISHATRCHNLGALICFVHDMCDIFLESTKLCIYFKVQGHKVKEWMEMMGNVLFACFTAVWFTGRLYWYPLKVIYAGVVYPRKLKLNIPYHLPMNFCMWGIFILHIYWTMLILKIFYRTLTGRILEDAREVDMTKKGSQQLFSKNKCSESILMKKRSSR